jgi:hypothetical protein
MEQLTAWRCIAAIQDYLHEHGQPKMSRDLWTAVWTIVKGDQVNDLESTTKESPNRGRGDGPAPGGVDTGVPVEGWTDILKTGR